MIIEHHYELAEVCFYFWSELRGLRFIDQQKSTIIIGIAAEQNNKTTV